MAHSSAPRSLPPDLSLLIGLAVDLDRWLAEATAGYQAWLAEYPAFTSHPSLEVSDEALAEELRRRAEAKSQ